MKHPTTTQRTFTAALTAARKDAVRARRWQTVTRAVCRESQREGERAMAEAAEREAEPCPKR